MKKVAIFLAFLTFVAFAKAQVAITDQNGYTPADCSLLDIHSANGNLGILIPQVSIDDVNSSSPVTGTIVEGLLVYSSGGAVPDGFYYWDGAKWVKFTQHGEAWELTGNAGTNPTVNFIGTTDNQPLVFRTNNTERVRITQDSGYVGIGTTNITYPLTIESFNQYRIGSFIAKRRNANVSAVYGQCDNTDYYGYGGYFKAGYTGILGSVMPTGSNYYFGIKSYVLGGSGYSYGVYTYLSSSNRNFGLYTYQYGSGFNFGLYSYQSGSGSNFGVYTYSYGNGTNIGLYSYPYGNGINYGVYTRPSGSGTNYGVYVNANSSGTDYGVYSYTYGDNDKGIFTQNSSGNGTALIALANGYSYTYLTDGQAIAATGRKTGIFGYANGTNQGTGIVAMGSGASGIYTLLGGSGGAFTGDTIGVYGYATSSRSTSGGYFSNANGAFAYVAYTSSGGTNYKIVGSGSNSTIVKGDKGLVTMFSPEAPEVLFQDYGTGQLKNGKAHIDLDPVFSKNIYISKEHPLRVFIQLEDDCKGVYVTNKTKYGFDVVELDGGTSEARFTWMVVANRADEYDDNGKLISRNQDIRFPAAPTPMKVEKRVLQTSVTQEPKLPDVTPDKEIADPKLKKELEELRNKSK